ncbi:MAG: leucine-rich repeat domain-containing protein, partial [Paramuribaculum sp.]|nr:leucine-rich repeat domain-containing protein [Paramuribaculum sp.]
GSSVFSFCLVLKSVTIRCSVTSICSSAFNGCTGLTSVTIPESVASLGSSAFNGCTGLTTLKIEDGESTLTLGINSSSNDLFSGCPLETVHMGRTLSYSNSPFRDQTKLTSLTIGDKVTSLGSSAFYGCSGLMSVTIPNSVTSIGSSAFSGCSALTTIISNAVTPPAIESNSFSNESYKYALVTVPAQSLSGYKEKWSRFYHLMGDGTEKSAEYHIDPAGGLVNMISPDEAESITSLKLTGTLNGTDLLTINRLINLNKLDISGCDIVSGGMPYYETDNERFGTKDNTLGQYWSRDLDLLAEIDLPATLTTLDKESLLNKRHLKSLTIPSSVMTVCDRALSGCDSIRQLIFQDSETEISFGSGFSNGSLEYLYLGRPVFADSYSYSAPFSRSPKLTKVVIGKSVTVVGSLQFSYCSGLSDLVFPNTLRAIGDHAFSGCTSLEQVAIPNPTESIGRSAFDGCSGLKELTLPGSVKSIGESAFAGCRQLGNVYVINPIPPVIESNTFDATTLTAATLHVPEDSKAINWVHPYWGKFKKI